MLVSIKLKLIIYLEYCQTMIIFRISERYQKHCYALSPTKILWNEERKYSRLTDLT